MKMTFQEIRIIATGPCIANQLRDVNTILEVKETTDTASSASFLDLYLEFDDIGQIGTKIYDKRDDFNFKIINFPNMCSNIPASPAYRQTSPFHYGSKFPAVTITVFITILEQNR
jgi:hypothetical protein